ncbi:MAG: AarF/ABC1/UbiB kinase family protein [Actinobacteria bacterium]|nr:MAG: AarF/ABC1/UbiB kinase family protein [Actinomycetota bacterium]
MGPRTERLKHALYVGRVARRGGLLRVLRELGVWGSRPATREGAVEFRRALEELGTTYIKLGQLLSSRPDLLPDAYIEELGKLVDDVPPVPFDEIQSLIAEELPADVFVRVDPEPLATASIAQIHTALLTSGRDVIVKVRRPGIEEQIDLDLALLRSTAGLLEARSERAQLLQARALADELEVHLRAELDFVEEAGNAELVAQLLEDYDELVVPQVIRPYVTEKVLVLERIDGRKVDSGHGLAADRAHELARQFFSAYVRQVTVEGVYHADPHRGNVLLTTDGRLALVDFGLLGRLDDDGRRNLALLLLAIAQNRADDVADLILSLSRASLGADEPGFIQELRRKLPRYHWRPLSGIRAGEALADLQRISFEYGIALPTSFALVGKTLAQADSIARVLHPELDPIALLEEDALEVMLHEGERRLEPNQLFAWLYTQLEPLGRMPRRLGQLVSKLETGTFKVGVTPTDLPDLEHALRSVANRIGGAVIVASLLIASALLARVHDLRWYAFGGFCAAFALGLYMIRKIMRTPGEL